MDRLRALREKGRQPATTCADDLFFMLLSCFVLGLLVHTLAIHLMVLGWTIYAMCYSLVIVVGSCLVRSEYMKVWRARKETE